METLKAHKIVKWGKARGHDITPGPTKRPDETTVERSASPSVVTASPIDYSNSQTGEERKKRRKLPKYLLEWTILIAIIVQFTIYFAVGMHESGSCERRIQEGDFEFILNHIPDEYLDYEFLQDSITL